MARSLWKSCRARGARDSMPDAMSLPRQTLSAIDKPPIAEQLPRTTGAPGFPQARLTPNLLNFPDLTVMPVFARPKLTTHYYRYLTFNLQG
jgi:hypothetical protein